MTNDRISLLLIDDNDDDRELTRRAVTNGFPNAVYTQVATAAAFESHVDQHFDCVITDYQLGWSNGLEVLKRLKERYPDQPVIMFTNTGSEDICAAGMRSGLSDYIVKRKEEFPKLPAAVRTALELVAARKELQEREARINDLLELERAARTEAVRANEMKDEFLAMLAHELRNPLAPISAAAELMGLREMDAAVLKRTSQVILRQVRHLTELVDDLVDVSRVTRGLVVLNRTPQEMKGIVAHAVEQARPLIEARRHHLVIDLPPQAAYVNGDGSRLVQILSNLLQNAARYTPESGNIVLRMEVDAKRVVLVVQDNGIGMTAELQSRVFDLFTQGKRTSDRSEGGLGLGLALVKSLVGLHHGTVTCHSEGLNKGSQFKVCLPRLAAAASHAEDEGAGTLHPAQTALRLLVVDDNVDAAHMLAMLLEALGHIALVEHDPMLALERARKDRPDACLLDIGLPGIDGNELASRLRKMPETENATLIAITGYGQDIDRTSALAAGFNHHLVKPVNMQKLIDLLAEVKS